MNTLYDVLGVKNTAGEEELRKSYRELARIHHPDINDDPSSNEKMAQINAAFETLIDPIRRMEYDAKLNGGIAGDPIQNSSENSGKQLVKIKLLHRFVEHKTPIYGVTLAPDNTELVSSSFDNELYFWCLNDDQLKRKMKLESGAVSTIVSSGRNLITAVGSSENTLTAWNVHGKKIDSWRLNVQDWVCSVKPSKDGEYIAFGTVNSKVGVVRSSNNDSIMTNIGHSQTVTALAWSCDSRLLATGSADASVIIWDVQKGKKVVHLTNIRSTVTAISFSPDNKKLAVAGVDLSIRIFDLENPSQFKIFFGHEKPIEVLEFHPSGKILASTGRDGNIGLWNISGSVRHTKIEASHQALNCLIFSHDGKKIIAGGLDKVLRVWSIAAPGL